MIDPKDYNHRLYDIAVEGTSKDGKWKLRKETMEPGEIQVTYDRVRGGCYLDCFSKPYPFVSLSSKDAAGGMMSDLPIEHESYQGAVEESHGKVLMCGLGLGFLPFLIEDKIESGEVKLVDAVELEPDVIELASKYLLPHFGSKFTILPGDAWDYMRNTDKKYDFIFMDIWLYMAEACVQGPKMKLIADQCLLPGGKSRYWMQEIKLSNHREGYKLDYKNPCKTCGKSPHSNLWGGLCLECAPTYERFHDKFRNLEKGELKSTSELSSQLISLGFQNIRREWSGKGVPDLVLEGSDGRFLVEAKPDLLDSATLHSLTEEILRRWDLGGKSYKFLQVVIFGNAKFELLEDLIDFTDKHCKEWVKIHTRGKIV